MTVGPDPRGRRIAVVADSLFTASLPGLRDAGYGVMQLPPDLLDEAVADEWLQQTAEQIAEYRRTEHDVVLVDDGTWGARLDAALAGLGVDALVRASPESGADPGRPNP